MCGCRFDALQNEYREGRSELPDALLTTRGSTHGKFEDNAGITNTVMCVLEASPNWPVIPPYMKVGIYMIVHKMARALSGDAFYPDHWEDVSGYAKLVLERIKPQ